MPTTHEYIPSVTEGQGGEPPQPPRVTTAADDEPTRDQVILVLQKFDIPAMYWPAFQHYARTGEIRGAEFRARVVMLSQFRDCLEALRDFAKRDFPLGDGFSRESFN